MLPGPKADRPGVAQITVGGKCYTNLTGNAVDVPLKDLGTSEQIPVQAADKAGNYSQTYQVKNPNYKAPAASQPAQTEKPTATPPAAATPVKPPATITTTPSTTAPSTATPPSGSASVTTDPEQTAKPLTPDGQGTVVDNVTDQDSNSLP